METDKLYRSVLLASCLIGACWISTRIDVCYAQVQDATVDQTTTESETVVVSGLASFADGMKAKKLRLSAKVFDKRLGDDVYYDCQTDDEGRFELEVKREHAGELRVIGITQDLFSGEIKYPGRFIGSTRSTRSTNREAQHKVVFENRGRLTVRVLGLIGVPDDYKVQIAIRLNSDDTFASNFGPSVSITKTTTAGELSKFLQKGLPPGEYRVEVTLPNYRKLSWIAEATVPAEEPFRAFAVVRVGALSFGSLRARVVMPDGSTPAANVKFNIKAFDSAYWIHTTDENGVLDIKHVPDGTVSVQPLRDQPGIAPTVSRIKVERGKTTEINRMRLKAESEVFSWMSGTLRYSDGTPVPRVSCFGYFSWKGGPNSYSSEAGFRADFHSDGRYRIRFPAGRKTLKIDIEGTGLSGAFSLGNTTCLVVDVQAELGEEIRRDIVVPLRDPEVTWKSFPQHDIPPSSPTQPEYDSILVDLKDGITWHSVGQLKPTLRIPAGKSWVYTGMEDRFLWSSLDSELFDFNTRSSHPCTFAIPRQLVDDVQRRIDSEPDIQPWDVRRLLLVVWVRLGDHEVVAIQKGLAFRNRPQKLQIRGSNYLLSHAFTPGMYRCELVYGQDVLDSKDFRVDEDDRETVAIGGSAELTD
ncbi:MAG TPA: hypothetical protein DDW52_25550 [Planctomycetaceae bacterium]|nr:hypothetical protein [Planctomycetaceae bacterium]